ncbi:hypothetical protein [Romboutsia ilealis]|nr:hypothetical protein [Romboutsia ilealis]
MIVIVLSYAILFAAKYYRHLLTAVDIVSIIICNELIIILL